MNHSPLFRAEKIETKKGRPALWWLVKMFFWNYDPETIYFTFGDTMYCSSYPEDYIIVHEGEHCKQMRYSKIFACLHFLKYRFSRKFRYRMELEAFRAEYKFICEKIGVRFDGKTLDFVAKKLSSSFYGVCTFEEAQRAILFNGIV